MAGQGQQPPGFNGFVQPPPLHGAWAAYMQQPHQQNAFLVQQPPNASFPSSHPPSLPGLGFAAPPPPPPGASQYPTSSFPPPPPATFSQPPPHFGQPTQPYHATPSFAPPGPPKAPRPHQNTTSNKPGAASRGGGTMNQQHHRQNSAGHPYMTPGNHIQQTFNGSGRPNDPQDALAPTGYGHQNQPSKQQVEQLKQFVRTLYENGFDFAHLVGDVLALDPAHLQRLFTELHLSTQSRAPPASQATRTVSTPTPNVTFGTASKLNTPFLSASAMRSSSQGQSPAPNASSQSTPPTSQVANGPVDRKDYIARLIAAKGKKSSPSQAGLSLSSAPSPAPDTQDDEAAAQRKAELARVREVALQSLKATQARKALEQSQLEQAGGMSGMQNSGADATPGTNSRPASASALPGLMMTGPWDQPSNVQSSTAQTSQFLGRHSQEDEESDDSSESEEDVTDTEMADHTSTLNPGFTQGRGSAPFAQPAIRPTASRLQSSSSLPPGEQNSTGDERMLSQKEQELRQMRLKLKLMEAKAKARAANQSTKSIGNVLAFAGMTTSGPTDSVVDAALTAGGSGVVSGAIDEASKTAVSQPHASNIPHPSDEASRKRKREDIESDLNAQKLRATDTVSRMEALRAQMRELEEAALKEEQDKQRLTSELESLGVDTENIPDSELQQTRDAVVAELQAQDSQPVDDDRQLQPETNISAPAEVAAPPAPPTADVPDPENVPVDDESDHADDEESDSDGSAMDESSDEEPVEEAAIDAVANELQATVPPPVPAEELRNGEDALDQDQDEYEPELDDDEVMADAPHPDSDNEDSDEDSDEDGELEDEHANVAEDENSSAASSSAAEDGEVEDSEEEAAADGVALEVPAPAPAPVAKPETTATLPSAPEIDGEAESTSGSGGSESGELSESDEDDSLYDQVTHSKPATSAPAAETAPPATSSPLAISVAPATIAPPVTSAPVATPAPPAAITRPSGPFEDDSSDEEGEISESDAEEQANASATNGVAVNDAEDEDDEMEDYEPPEESQRGMNDEDDDYEPAEVSPAASTSAEMQLLAARGDSNGAVRIYDGHSGLPDAYAQANSVPGPATAAEVPNAALQRSFTPYESPLSSFKDYRNNANYSQMTPGAYQSLTYSNQIDPRTPLCPVEASGQTCHDPMCAFQHFGTMRLTGNQLIYHFATDNPGKTLGEQRAFADGLDSLLKQQQALGVKDSERISALMTEYRRGFMEQMGQ